MRKKKKHRHAHPDYIHLSALQLRRRSEKVKQWLNGVLQVTLTHFVTCGNNKPSQCQRFSS